MSVRCWYTNFKLKVLSGEAHEQADDPFLFTREHLVARKSALFHHLTKQHINRNVVPASGFINNKMGRLPVFLKNECRENILAHLGGRDWTSKKWQEHTVKNIRRVITETLKPYRVSGHTILDNPVVVSATQTRFWTVENPYHEIMPWMLKERERILWQLHGESLAYVVQHYGFDPDEASPLIAKDLMIEDPAKQPRQTSLV